MRQQHSAAEQLTVSGEPDHVALEGALVVRTLATAERALGKPGIRPGKRSQHPQRSVDLSGLTAMDTPGALYLCELRDAGVELEGTRQEHRALLQLVASLDRRQIPEERRQPRWRELVVQLGKSADSTVRETVAVISFLGRSAAAIGYALRHPGSIKAASISRQVEETGINALPIIGLMAVMMSIVIGYQAVAQLRPYGGEDFTINLVAVSMLREMGVLVTAIMVAGRSGSAFAAEIGVMKSREEVDALQVMGMDPMATLVVPRLIGLVITLPLLTFFADLMGLAGGGIISLYTLEVSPSNYVQRVHAAATATQFFVGMVKAPVFACVIAVVGCMHGLRVSGSAESVGRETTRAVVKAIFLVLILDGLFSILFERLGL